MVKVKFVINSKVYDDVEMPCIPKTGDYVTFGATTSEVKEVEFQIESKGYFVRVIVRCLGDFVQTNYVSKYVVSRG